MAGRAFVDRSPTRGRALRAPRAALGRASVVAATVTILLVACTDPSQPPPSTPPPSSPAASTPPTAEQLRCLKEGTFVVDVATQLGRIVTTEGTEPGPSDEEQAVRDAQLQLGRLVARRVHGPFTADRAKLLVDANQIIEGNRLLLGRGDHELKRQAYLQVSAGGNEAITTAADARVKSASCVP
jgi:hypothetical protein